MPTRATRRAHEGDRVDPRPGSARRRAARAASRQVAQNGGWVDAPVQAATVQKLEDVILTKARDLRRQALPGAL
jgi:hypothetical protein